MVKIDVKIGFFKLKGSNLTLPLPAMDTARYKKRLEQALFTISSVD